MRFMLVASVIGFLVVLTACDPGIGIKIINKTQSDICFYEQERRVGEPDWCSEVPADETKEYDVICTSDEEILVLLTIGLDGERVYEHTATCGDWKESGRTVVVTEVAGEFKIADGMQETR